MGFNVGETWSSNFCCMYDEQWTHNIAKRTSPLKIKMLFCFLFRSYDLTKMFSHRSSTCKIKNNFCEVFGQDALGIFRLADVICSEWPKSSPLLVHWVDATYGVQMFFNMGIWNGQGYQAMWFILIFKDVLSFKGTHEWNLEIKVIPDLK